jgi:hypothetical protein
MKLTLLLIPLLFLSSCTIDWNDEKDKKITELEKQVVAQKEEVKTIKSDEGFKKKQECANYKEEMLEDINNPTYTRYKLDPELNEIFYSPKRKSCIYVYENFPIEDCLNLDLPHEEYIKFCTKDVSIVDFLTKETIFVENNNQREQYIKCFDSVRQSKDPNYDLCDRFTA